MRINHYFALLMMLLLLASNALAIKDWDDLTPEEQKSMLKVTSKVIPLEKNIFASSTVNPIRVNDPFASAGQPVIAEFTLANVGSDFPFNQIPLPADSFALVMAVDKEIGFRSEDGRSIDVLSKMTGLQKFMFITGLGFEVGVSDVTGALSGRTCQYVNVFDNLPKSVQEEVIDLNDNKKPEVYMWDCLKITDEATFEERIEEACEDDGFSRSCLAEINEKSANSILNTNVVALVSDVPKGTCEQARGKTMTSWIAKNVIKCGIGENGLRPGEQVTFKFVVIVPADTPVIQGEDLATSGEIQSEGFTYSASCMKSSNPKACHSIYSAVFPMATDNLLKITLDGMTDLFAVGGCGLNKLWFGSKSSFEACVEAKSTSIDVVGEPIYEGQGTFFVLAPQLDAQLTLVLFGITLSGVVSALSVTRRS